MTKAKPITVQITVTRPGLTIALLNASTAAIGLPEAAAMATPDINRTSLVSYFLMIAANVNTTMIAPTQTKEIPPKIIVILSIRAVYLFFLLDNRKDGALPSFLPNRIKTLQNLHQIYNNLLRVPVWRPDNVWRNIPPTTR
jgi:hypothetical protein